MHNAAVQHPVSTNVSKNQNIETLLSYQPELDKELEWRASNIQAIYQCVEQEQQKELVVWKTNTVVDPAHNHIRLLYNFNLIYTVQHSFLTQNDCTTIVV